jgi:hypothetical protein
MPAFRRSNPRPISRYSPSRNTPFRTDDLSLASAGWAGEQKRKTSRFGAGGRSLSCYQDEMQYPRENKL